MVTRLIALFLLFPTLLFSADFTATVSQNQATEGNSFSLQLTLRGTTPKSPPEIESLKKSYFIHSQQQSHHTVIVNGQATSNITWKYLLLPQKEGEAVIPSINIDTSEGILSSQPIKINVVKPSAESPNNHGIHLTTDVSNPSPYKNEPFIFTVKLASKENLLNVQIEKISIENTITEMNGEPKIFQMMVDGVRTNILEVSYLITPLKAGTLEIPSTFIQGSIPIRNKGSIFDDNLHLFSMMQGFDHLKPFAVGTEKVILDVQPVIAGMNPWIPAKSLHIEEIWDTSQAIQAGNPLTRGFKIAAEGVRANQLPNLNDLQINDPLFKIYADKPELIEDTKEGLIKSYRTEQYTLIPQQPGMLTLPEISIAWWDVTKQKKMVSRIPARTLEVLPAAESTSQEEIAFADIQATGLSSQAIDTPKDPLLCALIGGLAGLLAIALFWGIWLQKKISRLIREARDGNNRKKDSSDRETTKAYYVNKQSQQRPLRPQIQSTS